MGIFEGPNYDERGPVTIDTELLTGLRYPNATRAFLRIPYAAPPVEDLRWRPPQSPMAWTGIRPADKFGPSSLQFPPPARSLFYGGETDFSKDCLYLNVYTSPDATIAELRPVSIWFHIGVFMFGSASNPMYHGAVLAAEGITVVAVNYRLGRLGFFTHPGLTAESDHHESGNYGIMDQIAALEWVQRNFKAFGGDSGNVTIGGASAGGASMLRTSPLAKPLFPKAIYESRPGIAPLAGIVGHVAALLTLSAAEKAGAELGDILGASSLAELRRLPAMDIMAARLSVFDTPTPVVDGHILPESSLAALLSGRTADVPLLASNVGNEFCGLPFLDSKAKYHTYVTESFGKYAEDVLRLYHVDTDSEVRNTTTDLLADQCFVWPTWISARLQARALKSSTWYYRFLRPPPIGSDADVIEKGYAGAFHVSGGLYAFGNLESFDWDRTDADWALSKTMTQAWARFIRTGNPNTGEESAESWPALTPSCELIKIWDLVPRIEESGSRLLQVTERWDTCYGVDNFLSSMS